MKYANRVPSPPAWYSTPLRLASTMFTERLAHAKYIYIYIWRWIQSYQGIVQTWLVLNNSSFVFVFKCGVSVVCQLTWPLQTVSLFETRLPFIFLKDIPKQQSHPITTPQKTPGMWLAQPLTFARLIMSTARRQSHTSPILKSRFKNAHNLISKRLTEKVYQTIKRWVG